MQLIPKPNYNSMKRYLKRRRYQKLDSVTTSSSSSRKKKNVKITRLKGSSGRVLRIKMVQKLRLQIAIASPLQLWFQFKKVYVQMMNIWSGNKVGDLINNDKNVFGGKQIPKAQKGTTVVYSRDEVEDRLVLKIYKALMAACELSARQAQRVNIQIPS